MSKTIRTDVGFVHVRDENGQTHVIEPGGAVPDGVDVDKLDPTLFDDAEESEPTPVPGFGQTETHVKVAEEREAAAESGDAVDKLTVPELRDRLAAKGVTFESGDRKDALVAKARQAGING